MSILILSQTQSTFALTDPLKAKGIKIVRTIRNGKNTVDVDFPKWAKPKQTTDINYRLSVLPQATDTEYTEFMVVPTKGVIVPVIKISKSDWKYEKALKGQIIDSKWNDILTESINKGILHYPGTPMVGQMWLGRYFAHTSEFYHYKTPYATVWQAWAWLDPSKWEKPADEFYYYKRVSNGWKLYTYQVTKEKKITLIDTIKQINGVKVEVAVTSPTDQKILKWDKTKSEIAVIWCTDRGTDRHRWLTVGTLIKIEQLDAEGLVISTEPLPTTSLKTPPAVVTSNTPESQTLSATSLKANSTIPNPDIAF